jgi:hypothetical protein
VQSNAGAGLGAVQWLCTFVHVCSLMLARVSVGLHNNHWEVIEMDIRSMFFLGTYPKRLKVFLDTGESVTGYFITAHAGHKRKDGNYNVDLYNGDLLQVDGVDHSGYWGIIALSHVVRIVIIK